jgi:hypothetical protein
MTSLSPSTIRRRVKRRLKILDVSVVAFDPALWIPKYPVNKR